MSSRKSISIAVLVFAVASMISFRALARELGCQAGVCVSASQIGTNLKISYAVEGAFKFLIFLPSPPVGAVKATKYAAARGELVWQNSSGAAVNIYVRVYSDERVFKGAHFVFSPIKVPQSSGMTGTATP
ncbi:hypothetical protein JQ580_33130 [Bradyrhizobium japonicum]|uniref:hypothetical protein n=1 Tax=Bradyrhizobium japonicum TaxID=375 RepID=UPI001BA4F462|nr:hypothetical protein [Bradyrhizobium japonicum]MBR0995562.1 hypothetical protein [Bradyrhizobium japonicum]